MDSVVELPKAQANRLGPWSLKDAPTIVERVFPALKVGIEAQKERKSGAGQTLTALGSYWKGRKPLVLVRAAVLASLLPATADPDGDLELFEALMRMDFEGISRRNPKVTAEHVWHCADIPAAEKVAHIEVVGPPSPGDEVADGLEGGLDDRQEGGKKRNRAGISWRRIDLSHFDEREDEARRRGRERTDEARSSCRSAEARREAVAKIREETAAERASIREERKAERQRIDDERGRLRLQALAAMPFGQQVAISDRVEDVEHLAQKDDPLYAGIWERVNDRFGTDARSVPELVEQLGIARFGRRPVVGDPFAGGGSIPFEAARTGCDIVASDLNPVAAMLTWGALNIIGADEATRGRIAEEQRRVAAAVDAEITGLGIEHNAQGDRAKAFLYCLEVVDPQTGWRVPLLPSFVISRNRRTVIRLEPDYARKRFDILIEAGASAATLEAAVLGTVQDGDLVYSLAARPGTEAREWRIAIARLRGDGEGPPGSDGEPGNRLRRWEVQDVAPREPIWDPAAAPVLAGSGPGAWVGGDVFLERLFCVQWMDAKDLQAGKLRPASRFAAPEPVDLEREAWIRREVEANILDWQTAGMVPDMWIEPGVKTDEPIRTRGWTHWHHLFTPRQLLLLATMKRAIGAVADPVAAAALCFDLTFMADKSARLSRWEVGFPGSESTAPSADAVKSVFYNQALNTLYVYGAKSLFMLQSDENETFASFPVAAGGQVLTGEATRIARPSDIWIYDPPYADAVVYHEITEFFIAWLRRNPPAPFGKWAWDSRRPLAIQGKGDKFRADMVAAFSAMAEHMPDNGLQVCMFTHTDERVWADMAQIVWGAGLQVTAAWYVSTETVSELKKGGYVQGTVLLVLRKRKGDERAYKDEIVPAIRARVEEQVRALMGLNQRARGRQRDENLFSRADIQMAGYAAALEVLTGVTHLDGVDMTREALRPQEKGERGLVEEMIKLAVQTATDLMTPDGIEESLWERLTATERFYLTMMQTEAERPEGQPGGKLDDYQNFAKAYRADGWEDLMADRNPGQARLKGAAEFRRALMTGHPFSDGLLRPTLYAINELRIATEREEDPKVAADRVLHGLRDHFDEWVRQRNPVREVASWLGRMWARHRPAEAGAARQLAGIIQTERL